MDPLKANRLLPHKQLHNLQTERCSASAWRSHLQSSSLLHVTIKDGRKSRLWSSASDWIKQTFNQSEVILDLASHHIMPHGISALVTKTSFCGENNDSVARCRLFSQCTALCILG